MRKKKVNERARILYLFPNLTFEAEEKEKTEKEKLKEEMRGKKQEEEIWQE